MTEGERYIERFPRKTRFHDRNERRSYEVTRLVAARLIDDPTLVERGRDFMDRHMAGDPHQKRYCEVWNELLTHDVKEIAGLLLEDSPGGSLLRDTQPVFHVPTDAERKIAHLNSRSGGASLAVEGPSP